MGHEPPARPGPDPRPSRSRTAWRPTLPAPSRQLTQQEGKIVKVTMPKEQPARRHDSTAEQVISVDPPRSWSPGSGQRRRLRSEEHTSELQSRENLVCRLLLEKKK